MKTRTLQVQRYWMGNLPQGVEPAAFRRLFGLDAREYLQHKHPAVFANLVVERGEDRLVGARGSGHDHAVALFDPALRGRLYRQHVGQPKGWPAKEMAEAKGEAPFQPDLNWNRFLALRLSKGHTYPPGPVDPITDAQVQQAWADLGHRIRRGGALEAVGPYCHVPYGASTRRSCYCYEHLVENPDVLASYVPTRLHRVSRLAPSLDGIRLDSAYFGGGFRVSADGETQRERMLATSSGALSYGSTEEGHRRYMQNRHDVDLDFGHTIDLEDDMTRDLISNLRGDIDRTEYHRIFREDPLTRFWRPFLWMQQQGLVEVDRTHIRSRMRSSHGSVVTAKARLASKYHEDLRLAYDGEYDAATDHGEVFRRAYARSF